jgi:manganese/zinc/iron transport system permease protein
MNWLDYFTDPILRAPTWGCILMSVAASLMGVVLYLQKRLLVGESTAHAAYPGAVCGLVLTSALGQSAQESSAVAVLAGAFTTSWLGLKLLAILERRYKIQSDSALCFILSVFFGSGVLAASWLQAVDPVGASQIQMLLFGQAATLTDAHVLLYVILACGTLFFLLAAFRPVQALLFDRNFAGAIGIRSQAVERTLVFLLLLSFVIGIRSVGVVLLSGMLIGPAVAARQIARRLKTLFFAAAGIGALSGLLGNVISVETALRSTSHTIPTGPAIVLVSGAIALMSLLFAPGRGVLFRILRRTAFQVRCLEENVLKGIWKRGGMTHLELKQRYPTLIRLVVWRLVKQGWLVGQTRSLYQLTPDGVLRAERIIRLHRLWELYMTQQLGVHAERVHLSAEEMEHVLTPELERQLTEVLADPQRDPHDQPIPQKQGGL